MSDQSVRALPGRAAELRAPARARRHTTGRTAAVFLLPSLLGLLLFLVGPLLASLLLSFSNWQVIGETRFVGLANYVNLLSRDPIFWQILRVTFSYSVEYVVLNIALSLVMAVWINSLSWGRTFFRLVFFLPTFTPAVGTAIVWLLMLSPGGVADWVAAGLHLPVGNLLTTPAGALQALVAITLWSHFGYNMLLFGSALDSIPAVYMDAAAIDGASAWRQFWAIRLPLISPSLFFGTVLTTITSLQAFDQVYALTRGGPGSATTTLGYAIYTQGFVNYRLGYASATAWLLFAIIMVLTAFQLRLQRRWVHYDA